jgi:hypothetical protein
VLKATLIAWQAGEEACMRAYHSYLQYTLVPEIVLSCNRSERVAEMVFPFIRSQPYAKMVLPCNRSQPDAEIVFVINKI